LNQFVLEARDTNTAITLISQNASHFTYCREGREILDNMPGKVFMRHDRVPEDVVDYFQLSQQEKQELYELKTGTDSAYSEALLKITGRLDTRVKIESTQVEESIINRGEEA
jgi:type IV secretory pathway VirB4 component